MRKIVFVVPDMAGGGTEKVISLLANEYVKRGIPTAILSFAGEQQAYPLRKEVELFSAGLPSHGNGMVRMQRLKKMREFFKQNPGCQIFSFSTIGTGFIVLSTLGMKRHMVVSERTDPQTCDHKPYRNFFYRFADRIVCQTEDALKCFPKGIQKKGIVIGNPIEKDLPDVDLKNTKLKIVAAGRLEPVKNHRLLIEAFQEFSRNFPEYTLEIFGQGSMEKELKNLVAKENLEGKVIFRGFSKNLKDEVKDSRMFVLSSDYEGISNSMIEALAMGIPVIATDCPIGGCKTYISHGENGLLVPVRNKEALVEAMTQIAQDEQLAQKLSENGKKIRSECSVEQIADAMLQSAERIQ